MANAADEKRSLSEDRPGFELGSASQGGREGGPTQTVPVDPTSDSAPGGERSDAPDTSEGETDVPTPGTGTPNDEGDEGDDDDMQPTG